MFRVILLAAIAIAAAPQLSAKSPPKSAGCSVFLVGNWAGAGTVAGFGPPMQVASTASYKSNGTFASSTRYLGHDKKWTEQKIAGTWRVAAGKAAKSCTLALKSVTAIGESRSTSDFTIVDADTYRAFGIDLKRVR